MPAKRFAERQTVEDSQASRKAKANKILVVGFGDSLTAGDQPPRPGAPLPKSTPYTDPLKELIDGALDKIGKLKLVQVIIYNKGVSGETTSDMMRRLDSDVLSVKPSYTIILGGSNDIGWGVDQRKSQIIWFRMRSYPQKGLRWSPAQSRLSSEQIPT